LYDVWGPDAGVLGSGPGWEGFHSVMDVALLVFEKRHGFEVWGGCDWDVGSAALG